MSSRVNLADNEVTIVLFDQGVGIPNTLDPTAYESIRAALANISNLKLSTQPSAGEMILAATEYHRSGTGGKGRGRGFADMKRFVRWEERRVGKEYVSKGRYQWCRRHEKKKK